MENSLLLQTDIDVLLTKLHHYQSQSDRLQKVNELYRKLAGITDLPTMIESFSIWLAQYVPHELIGYSSRQKMHMYCSCHGVRRRQVISIAEQLLQHQDSDADRHAVIDGFHSHKWSFENNGHSGALVLLRKDQKIPDEEMNLIDESMSTLAEPLQKTHDYEEILRQARIDPLTGLPNRLVFEERIDYMLERARRHNHPLSLAALDLDHFKEVNDSMGHLYGDEVLKQVAAALQEKIRLQDLLVRMGGDELLLALADTDLSAAHSLCERLCRTVKELNIKAGTKKLGISIGLAQWQKGLSKKEWLERADDALYQAKKSGRSKVVHYTKAATSEHT